MPYFKCTKCHHEWEGMSDQDICDWCDSVGVILEDRTPLQLTIEDYFKSRREEWMTES